MQKQLLSEELKKMNYSQDRSKILIDIPKNSIPIIKCLVNTKKDKNPIIVGEIKVAPKYNTDMLEKKDARDFF